MKNHCLHKLLLGLSATVAVLALTAQPVMAQRVAVGFHGGFHGGGWHGGYGGYGRGGYWGGGWGRGGYWGGGWGWRGGYWYPGLGLGLGLYYASLPYYYSTYWYGGVPYYYGGNTFYRWDGSAGQYVTVAPPEQMLRQMPGSSSSATQPQSDVIAYPKNGQSDAQLRQDKFECHKWASGQTGFDPTQPAGGGAVSRRNDYFRAQSACLEGRGYAVK